MDEQHFPQQEGPCAGCGKAGGEFAVSAASQLTGRTAWWHKGCLPPNLAVIFLVDDSEDSD